MIYQVVRTGSGREQKQKRREAGAGPRLIFSSRRSPLLMRRLLYCAKGTTFGLCGMLNAHRCLWGGWCCGLCAWSCSLLLLFLGVLVAQRLLLLFFWGVALLHESVVVVVVVYIDDDTAAADGYFVLIFAQGQFPTAN